MTAPRESRPEHVVLSLLAGKWLSQAVSTAAELGVADLLADGPQDIPTLAAQLDCPPDMLQRLMVVLAGEGLFSFDDTTDRYAVTETGALLGGGEGSLRNLAAFIGSPAQWAPWPRLAEAIRSGRTAYELAHGQSLYDWLENHPREAALYDEGIDRFTAAVAHAMAETFDCSDITSFVDVGGGLGTSSIALLRRWSHLQGVLLDLPHVLERAQPRIAQAGLSERCRCQVGNFFEPLPPGYDLYVLKHVLHNWSDQDATRILKRCREAARPDSVLIAVEGILHPGSHRSMSRLMDLEMMVLFGKGRARTKASLRSLFKDAGWQLERRTRPLDDFARLLVARPSGA